MLVPALVLLRALVDLLAPRRCAACDLELEPDDLSFCEGCRVGVELAPPPRAAFVFGGPVAEAIRRLKYEGRRELARELAPWLAAAAEVYAGQVDRVVPVPLHPSRLAARGFNQSALLARPVARHLGVPLDTAWLRRVRPTLPQVGLGRAERERNLRGAFATRDDKAGARVLLVDDVRSSGATLTSAAQALFDGGAETVFPVSLAVRWGDGPAGEPGDGAKRAAQEPVDGDEPAAQAADTGPTMDTGTS